MNSVACVGLIPAERDVNAKAGLNVLVLAVNRSERSETAGVALFGAVDSITRKLCEKHCTLSPAEHAHLYFHIPAECFAPEMWNGEDCEEMILYAGTDTPETAGELVFIDR